MIKQEYFSSPIYYEDKPEWLDKLNKLSDPYIADARKASSEVVKKNIKEKGYKNDIGQTYHSLSLIDDEDFSFFHDYMAKKSRWVLDDMGYDMEKYSIFFNDSWVQEFSFNGAGHHWFHTHSNSHISGFYFLKASKFTSKPLFQDPRSSHLGLKLKEKDSEKVTNACDLINYEVKPGSLILFPAYLSHAYAVDHGIEPFRFIHINMRAIEKDILKQL
tara:strand:+ start:10 stop:660 length:651 start_codon:yes stop_codon:yes gene_type:complete